MAQRAGPEASALISNNHSLLSQDILLGMSIFIGYAGLRTSRNNDRSEKR